MDKNLVPKFALIILMVAAALWISYPFNKTLRQGIDLAGGTSLIYQIDTQGLESDEKAGLSQRMITVLRRRIDPHNIQNLIWRPQGNTRFEIQMPLADAETRQRRRDYESVRNELLAENINPAIIMRSLVKPQEQRDKDFETFAKGSSERLEILNNLASVHDQRVELQNKRDELSSKLKSTEEKISDLGLDLVQIKQRRNDWSKLNEKELTEALKSISKSDDNLDLLKGYVNTYAEWADVTEELTNPDTGKNIQYTEAKRQLDKLNLSEDQIDFVLGLNEGERNRTIEQIKEDFTDRAEKIDKVVEAFIEYRPYRGRLDDPADLQRMMKGAGILEFRILPTWGHPEVETDKLAGYIELLKTKGPKYASDATGNKYVWCEIEDVKVKEWIASNEAGEIIGKYADGQGRPCIVAAFGNKYYVLASNRKNEVMLHSVGEKDWKLKKAFPRQDQMGRRAIGFLLDERGGKIFANVTGKNIDRPLSIMLDGIAISAPNIQNRISTQGIITGRFDEVEQADMVSKLNAGTLPAMLIEQPISVKTIGPSIGADNRNKGIKAGLIGLIVVVACMAIYYTLAGGIADVALFMNLLFVLAIMALARATFTLPGIAGIILTIGMSVDANVLIFERIREEQQRGASLRIAIRNGYQRAFRAIFDANITTFITAAILYWVASEEIKGFAIVLMLGIVSSMFTALFVTRVIFEFLLSKRIIKDHLFMLRIIRAPKINWMTLRPVFFTISIVLIAAGLVVFFTRDDAKNNKYDIEFTGGTSVQINLKEGVSLSRQEVEDRIHEIAIKQGESALATANVYSIGETGRQYVINTTETNKTTVTAKFETGQTVESIISRIGDKLKNLNVKALSNPSEFVVTTSMPNKSLVRNVLSTSFPDANISEPKVDEIVNDLILTAFSDELEIQRNLQSEIISEEKITEVLIESYPELTDFLGGIKLTCEIKIPATVEEIQKRLADLRFKPDMQELNWYSYKILGPDLNPIESNQPLQSFVYLSAEPEAGLRQLTENEWKGFVDNEKTKVLTASRLETSLPRVTQIDPSVGAEAKTRALIAIILSLFAIVTYIWVRFGNVHYGVAAIVALVHDVCITLGAVTACTYIAATTLGERLLIGDFKIDLAMIAAFLTIIGYSLNDTIVVFDRIRENRRKRQLNPQIISNSINETLSRTLLTSFTTFIVVLIIYIFGGQNLRGFTFAIGFGIIVGTYSSIAIAAPVLLIGAKKEQEK